MSKEKKHIFPIVVIIICGWTTLNLFSYLADYYSLASVILGIIGISLYYNDNPSYDRVLYTWIYLQIPNITYAGLPFASSFPLSFGLGITLGLRNDQSLELYFNALPIGLYFLFKYLNAEKSIGYILNINRLRKGTFTQIQFPVKGKVESISGRNKFDAIYLVSLDTEIEIKGKKYFHILLEPRNGNLIKSNEKHQIMGLRLCELPNFAYNEKQNLFVDWVTVDSLKTEKI